MSANQNADNGLPTFEAGWVLCVGCGLRVPLVADPADTPEHHRSRCLGLHLSPESRGDA